MAPFFYSTLLSNNALTTLKLISAQQHQGTRLFNVDTGLLQRRIGRRRFCPRIKNNPARRQLYQMVDEGQ